MSNQDQHYKVQIKLDGNSKVSFWTHLGWEEDAAVTVDAVGIEGVNRAVEEFVNQRKVVPFENWTSNECYIDQAKSDIESIKNIVLENKWADSGEINRVSDRYDSIYIGVSITKSYVI